MKEDKMDKVKISKALLNGVELCNKQLASIKSQLNIFLSDNNEDDKNVDNHLKRKSHHKSKEVQSNKRVKSVTMVENGAESTASGDSTNTKDKSYSNSSESSKDDKAYKPYKYEKKMMKSVNETKGRGRPPKKNTEKASVNGRTELIEVAVKKRGRPRNTEVQEEEDFIKPKKIGRLSKRHIETGDESEVSVKDKENKDIEKNATPKKSRGRPSKSNSVDKSQSSQVDNGGSSKDGDKEKVTEEIKSPKRGRGRPSKMASLDGKGYTESSGSVNDAEKSQVTTEDDTSIPVNRGRGRPLKNNKSNGVKSGRGRPRKQKETMDEGESSNIDNEEGAIVPSTPARRGRPPKAEKDESIAATE